MSVKIENTAIKGLYLGNNALQKAYLGSNLIYQKGGNYEDIKFTSCPFPTSWTEVVAGTKYKATNDYGEWRVISTDTSTLNNACYKAFDSYYDTVCCLSTNPRWVEIDLPDGVLIKPSDYYISFGRSTNTDEIQGFNPLTNQWEKIKNLLRTRTQSSQNYNYNGSTYFSKFRIYSTEIYTSSQSALYIYSFNINGGMLRKEN